MLCPDAEVENLFLPQARGVPEIHRRPDCPGRAGPQGRGVRPGIASLPYAQPSENSVLVSQRFLSVAQAPGGRGFQVQRGCR